MEAKTKGVIIFQRNGLYSGFMGNLMFEIAATVGIARKNGLTPVFADTGYYNRDFYTYFKGTFNTMSVEELAKIECEEISEPHFHYHDFVLDPNKNYNLTGYFQSKRYWEHCEDEIRELFEFTDHVKFFSNPSVNCNYYGGIESQVKILCTIFGKPFSNENWQCLSNAISIHVRRGDYIKHPNEHPVMPIGYYKKAIGKLIKQDSVLIIFSDDIEWCKENFAEELFANRIYFCESNSQAVDLSVMMKCANNIICNSSFSWWGSYLNKNPNKIVIAPKKENWFGVARKDWNVTDLYRHEFIEI